MTDLTHQLSYVSTDPQTVKLSDAAGAPSVIQQTILREGQWKHAGAPGGVLDVNKGLLDELKANFEHGVGLGGDSLPFHFGHTEDKDERSVAWGHKLSVVADEARPGKHKMVVEAGFTSPEHAKAVLGGEWAFTSPTILFGYKDKETQQSHRAVIRNVAFTNYPYLQQMGRAQVVNLSEVSHSVLEAEKTARLASAGTASLPGAGLDFASGGGGAGEPNPDGLPEGYDLTKLPKQCLTCAKMGNDCPFAGDKADADVALKTAAAGSGNCPQYVEADSQAPGGGGAADAANASPAVGRKAGAIALDDGDGAGAAPDGDGDADDVPPLAYGQMLYQASERGMAGHPQHAFVHKHGRAMHQGLRKGHLAQFEAKAKGAKRGDKPVTHVRITRSGQKALTTMQRGATALPMTAARLTDTAALAASRPQGTGPKGTIMNDTRAQRQAQRIAEIEAADQKTFITSLAETHKLPAAVLKTVDDAFADGQSLSVKLSQALESTDAEIVRLSEDPDAEVSRPKELDAVLKGELAKVDLSDCVTLPRATLRTLLSSLAASERTGEVQLSDTKQVEGDRPDAAKPKKTAEAVQSEKDPDKALALLREAEKNGDA